MADFKELISLIQKSVDKFNEQIPGIQDKVLAQILREVQGLEVKDGRVKIAAANIKRIAAIKSKIERVILSDDYVSNVKEYLGTFDKITSIQNAYFTDISTKFKQPKLTKEIKKLAIESTAQSLTEAGLQANITEPVTDLLRKAITGGASIETLQRQLRDFMTENSSGPGQIQRYARQITTDALNQYSGQYSQIVSSDLGMEWFRYSGSNIETSRPFCLACTDRKFFHISELPKVIKGEFEEFRKYDGKINPKTGLPTGMVPGTDVTNLMTYRGGYNCGHQLRPVTEDAVPENIKNSVYRSPEYKSWAKARGIKEKDLPAVSKNEMKGMQKFDLNSLKSFKSISDVDSLFKSHKDIISEWFKDKELRKISTSPRIRANGQTDMNGNIALSEEKSRQLTEAFQKIKTGKELSLKNEKAIATLWHEIWHNRNRSNRVIYMTNRQQQFMELGNEFVARKTLDQFYEKLGTKMKYESLKETRDDTAYNEWVVNYDHLIKHFKADQNSVLNYMIDKMENGSYDNVKEYLIDAILESGAKADRDEIGRGVVSTLFSSELSFKNSYPIR